MFESTLSNVISIDIDNEIIHFFSTDPKDKKTIRHDAQSYRARPFDDEFFEKFSHILKLHSEHNPNQQMQKVSLILPDTVFLTDMINIPTIQKKAMSTSLEVAIQAIYKNIDELSYKTFSAAQNKQYTTYGLVGIRKDIISKFKDVCSDNHVSISNVTFAANATVNGAFALNPKLKNGSFLLLDIKEKSAQLSLAVKGRTVGSYSLPFGYSILSKTIKVSEDLLFDHSPAELLVLNAKERARAKQLTVGEEFMAMKSEPEIATEEHEEEQTEVAEAAEDSFETVYSAGLSKKVARKLPKFMQREAPTSEEGYVYENFRIFLKWTLDFISNNATLVNLGEIDTVYVNMPQENAFLYDMINADEEEHKVRFLPLLDSAEQDNAARNLDLYGGFYVKQYNKINNF